MVESREGTIVIIRIFASKPIGGVGVQFLHM